MSNIALAVRQYGEGRICVSTDRIGGYLTGHGDNPWLFWRRILEWTGQRFPSELINIAVVQSTETYNINVLNSFEQINITEISMHDLLFETFQTYDLIYFVGLPEEVDQDAHDRIEEFVRLGGGMLIESPDKLGDINILTSIDNVGVSSINKPIETLAFWTEIGKTHYTYTTPVYVSFMVEIENTAFSSAWSVLMSDVEVQEVQEAPPITIITSGQIGSEFGVSYLCRMKYGIVNIEEDEGLGNESSSSSIDSSSSSSSSSFNDDHAWNFCDNIVAQWKLNDNNSSPVVWDNSGDIQHMGELQDDLGTILTKDRSVPGRINRAIILNGSNEYIETSSNKTLNFVSGGADTPFSISMWVFISDISDGYLMRKQGVWQVYLVDGKLNVILENGGNGRFRATELPNLENNKWHHIVITYDGINNDGISIYHEGNLKSSIGVDLGYTSMADLDSPLDIGFAGGSYLNGIVDNFIIVDKVFNQYEISGLFNLGRGTEECYGVEEYDTSSSSSSSISSVSSSSSIDSSSSSDLSMSSKSSSSNSSYSISSESSSSSGDGDESSSSEYINTAYCISFADGWTNSHFGAGPRGLNEYSFDGYYNGYPQYVENPSELAQHSWITYIRKMIYDGTMQWVFYSVGTPPTYPIDRVALYSGSNADTPEGLTFYFIYYDFEPQPTGIVFDCDESSSTSGGYSSGSSESSKSSESIGNESSSSDKFSESSSSEKYSESSWSMSSSSSSFGYTSESSSSSFAYSSESSSSLVGTTRCFDIDIISPTACEIMEFSMFGVNASNSDNGTLYGTAIRSGENVGVILYKDVAKLNVVANGFIKQNNIPGVFDIDEVFGSGIYGTVIIYVKPVGGWERNFYLEVH